MRTILRRPAGDLPRHDSVPSCVGWPRVSSEKANMHVAPTVPSAVLASLMIPGAIQAEPWTLHVCPSELGRLLLQKLRRSMV